MFFAWRVGNYSVAAAAAAAATFSVWQFRSYTLAAAAAAAAGYVIYRSVSQSKHEKNMENDVSTWKRAVDAIYLVAEQLDVSEEFDGHTLTIPLLLRIALHASASETEEERLDKVRLPWARETHGLLEPEELKLARVAMRHASAVYGAALLAFFNLTARPSAEELRDLSVHDMDRTCICEYTGVAADDLVVMKTESLDMVGNDSCLSHYVAVDHAAGAVVLALRGTASMSDVLHDAVAHSEPFCGGRAHSGMADMARAVWVEAGHAVRRGRMHACFAPDILVTPPAVATACRELPPHTYKVSCSLLLFCPLAFAANPRSRYRSAAAHSAHASLIRARGQIDALSKQGELRLARRLAEWQRLYMVAKIVSLFLAVSAVCLVLFTAALHAALHGEPSS
eukprot:4854258-Pleurochrysis_carterae.AAC.2